MHKIVGRTSKGVHYNFIGNVEFDTNKAVSR